LILTSPLGSLQSQLTRTLDPIPQFCRNIEI
jgi:hypothetical protein